MYLAEITFHLSEKIIPLLSSEEGETHEEIQQDLENGLYGLLNAWQHNGQISSGSIDIIRLADKCITYVRIPEIDSLHGSYNRSPVEQALEAAKKLLSTNVPEVRIIGKIFDDIDNCQCASRESYILFSTFVGRGSPLRCGTCFQPIPLYQIPPTNGENYQDIESWQSAYEACDTLNMHSGALEEAAINELSKHDSQLSKEGRTICHTIEQHTGKPVYYYLYRWSGQSRKTELERLCPECGGEWLLPKAWHSLFEFKCDRCRLLSNIASDIQEPEGAPV